MADVIRMKDLEGSMTTPITGKGNEVVEEYHGDHQKAGDLPVKIVSRIRSNDDVDPGPPPDGGLRAWSMAFAAHLVLFNIWGVSSRSLCRLFLVAGLPVILLSTALQTDRFAVHQ